MKINLVNVIKSMNQGKSIFITLWFQRLIFCTYRVIVLIYYFLPIFIKIIFFFLSVPFHLHLWIFHFILFFYLCFLIIVGCYIHQVGLFWENWLIIGQEWILRNQIKVLWLLKLIWQVWNQLISSFFLIDLNHSILSLFLTHLIQKIRVFEKCSISFLRVD